MCDCSLSRLVASALYSYFGYRIIIPSVVDSSATHDLVLLIFFIFSSTSILYACKHSTLIPNVSQLYTNKAIKELIIGDNTYCTFNYYRWFCAHVSTFFVCDKLIRWFFNRFTFTPYIALYCSFFEDWRALCFQIIQYKWFNFRPWI